MEIESSSDSDENIFEDDELDTARAPFEETLQVVSEAGPPSYNQPSKQFITTKLVNVLDKCKVSDRDATHLLFATAKALGHKVDELVINRSSISRSREKLRKERSTQLREAFDTNFLKRQLFIGMKICFLY